MKLNWALDKLNENMKNSTQNYSKILELLNEAQKLAADTGISNLFQPGLAKEIVISQLLGHKLNHNKHDSNACNPNNPDLKYQYLCCSDKQGQQFQIDRVFKAPVAARNQSLHRIVRNDKIFCCVTAADNPLEIKEIHEIKPTICMKEAARQLKNSKNNIAHLSFSKNWAQKNGKLVYKK